MGINKLRARVGWNTPRRVIDAQAFEFYQVAPKDVMLVCNHLNIRESSNLDECKAAFALIDSSVDSLIEARVDIIVQMGAPVHFIEGIEGYRKMLKRLQAKSNIPVTTSSEALLGAFRQLAVSRILMVSTWPKERKYPHEMLEAFFTEGGVEIVNVKHIPHGLLSINKANITPSQIYEQIKAGLSETPDVEAVYLQSGTLRSISFLEEWEKEIKKPVVSEDNAIICGSFRPLNITVGTGYGKLLASLG